MARKRQQHPSSSHARKGSAVASEGVPTRIAWMATCALTIAVPLVTANFELAGSDAGALLANQVALPKTIAIAVLLVTAAGAALVANAYGELDRRRTPFDVALLAVLGILAATMPFATNVPHALMGSYERLEGYVAYIAYAVAFVLGVHMVSNAGRLLALSRAMAYTAGAVSAYALLQAIGADPIAWSVPWESGRVFGTYGNPQLFGGYLALTLPIALGLAFAEETGKRRVWAGLSTSIIAVALVLTYTRSAWAGGAVGCALVLGLVLRRDPAKRQAVAGVAAAGGALTVIIGALSARSSSDVTNLFARLLSTFDATSGSVVTRIGIMNAAAEAASARPLTGWGLDSFGLVWQRFVPASYVARAGWQASADNAHNWPLHMAATAGVPAALLLVGSVVWMLVATARHAFGQGDSRLLAYGGMWAAAVSYLIHLQGSLSVPGATILFWLVLGILARPLSRKAGARVCLPKTAATVTVALAAVTTLALSASVIRADHAALRARDAASAAVRVAECNTARTAAPWMLKYRADLAKAHHLLASEGPSGSPIAIAAYESAKTEYRALITNAPAWPDPYIDLISVYNVGVSLAGDESLAREALSVAETAAAMAPNSPLLKARYAVAMANTGSTENALRLLSEASALDPAYSEPWILRYRILMANGDENGAAETAQVMQSMFPQDASVMAATAEAR